MKRSSGTKGEGRGGSLVCALAISAWLAGTAGRADAADAPAAGVPINQRLLAQQRVFAPVPYDSEPAFVLDAAGRGYAVWHSFTAGDERIVGRTLPAGRDTVMLDVSGGRGTVAEPEVAGAGGKFCVTWAAFTGNRWRVLARRSQGDTWTAPEIVSDEETEALHPVVTPAGPGEFALAWVEFREGRFRISTASMGAGRGVATVSDPNFDSFRPTFATDAAGERWIFWDAYERGTSVVKTRRLTPVFGPIETVSTSPDRCLKAIAAGGPGGLHVAWLRVTDVRGGDGVIDQRHGIQVARRSGDRWQILTDARGRDDAAVLNQGLLARLEPKPAPTGGYLGRRREPMLVRDGDAFWLLWERKANHAGDTSNVTGELAGRRLSAGRMDEPVSLAKGWVDYRVPHDAEVHHGALSVLASTLPRDGTRLYHLLSVPLRGAPLVDEPWPGWTPVTLPLAETAPMRRELQDGGRTYRLFWMDSHVHSGLTADAEGEPDEIMLYARDRGRLDALVMQENDFYNCPLTDAEYQIGAFYARAFSRPGAFVALPGYEWTQQVPADPELAKDQPRFWRASYPNHRTVIYPRAGGPLIRYVDVHGDISQLYAAVERAGGVLHTQHPTFDFVDHPVETSIEVSAGWGVYFLNPGRIHQTLNQGHRAGFVGTSDSHRRNPGLGGGLTGIYATELTPEAILEAYRRHRVFATSGSRVALEARANGVFMGAEATAPDGRVHLTLRVQGTRPIRRATLIRDGVNLVVRTSSGDATAAEFDYQDGAVPPGVHWYYWRVEQEGGSSHYGGNVASALGHLAWSTPHWVRVTGP